MVFRRDETAICVFSRSLRRGRKNMAKNAFPHVLLRLNEGFLGSILARLAGHNVLEFIEVPPVLRMLIFSRTLRRGRKNMVKNVFPPVLLCFYGGFLGFVLDR